VASAIGIGGVHAGMTFNPFFFSTSIKIVLASTAV